VTTAPPWVQVTRLAPQHDTAAFCCGELDIDEWLHNTAMTESNNGRISPWVCLDADGRIVAYFALMTIVVVNGDLSGKLKNGNGSDSTAILLAKMGMHKGHRGNGLSPLLMLEVFKACYEADRHSAVRLVVVDALTDKLVPFYQRHNFKEMASTKRRLVQKMSTVRTAIEMYNAN
jgi:GNAT superfamily N-acetyltransferase